MGLRQSARILVACALAASVFPALASAQQTAGVLVDAEGVLRTSYVQDPSGQLMRERISAARSQLTPELARTSSLRKISLNRLEAAIEAQLAMDRQPTDEMRHLAGLTRLTHVFLYPESGDIVVAGPAEGWTQDLSGRVVGIESGRATLLLEDLLVALRMYPPGQKPDQVLGCSIDPTPEGLARMQQFLAEFGTRATPADTQYIVEGLRTNLGLQNVRILGVPPKSHFAQVLVEADYRMKMIGIGLEQPPIKMASYIDKANPSQVARNAIQRWYFTPDYQCVVLSDDDQAMQLVGEGVKLIGADEMVHGDGSRSRAARPDKASELFVTAFTRKYPELAAKSPVYAQLRNLIDMAIAAAFIQDKDYYSQVDWTADTLRDESKVPVETYAEPVQVETVVTSVWRGNQLMTPVGGGVHIEPQEALSYDNIRHDNDGQLEQQRQNITLDLADGQWWWD